MFNPLKRLKALNKIFLKITHRVSQSVLKKKKKTTDLSTDLEFNKPRFKPNPTIISHE